jgi:putative endonuclease
MPVESRSPRPDPRPALGRRAEALAAAHLAGLGWQVLDRNHRCKQGELDLVCRDGGYIRFVEVRSRTGEQQGGPEESVGHVKARRVVAAATDWALSHGGLEQRFRFDVVAVTFGEGDAAPEIRVFLDAFDGDGRPGFW